MNQRRTIIGMCDYSIAGLQQLKRDLMDVGNKNQEINWAVGGIVLTLVSNLLQTCEVVFKESMETGIPDAKQDLNEIKQRFNSFIDGMVNHE